MNEQKIQQLLDDLFKLKYDWRIDDRNYTRDVIDKEGRQNVENIIRAFLLENRDEKLGILQAKVFMYEEIISKSNFAPMIKTVKTKKPINP